MAGTSPRRSVRARTSQPNSGSHHSSTSSNSSVRADRAIRTSIKVDSPRKSTPTGSLSSETLEESVAAAIEENIQGRRRKRGQPEEQDKASSKEDISTEVVNGTDDLVEDDEAVRCICGNEDYPGPPPLPEEDSKKGIKDSSEIDLVTETDYTEDLAGFFVQCDTCKVWQHGLCVGIKNEAESPDEYFCEICRKDLHRIFTAHNGQKYSHYLPLYQTLSRTTSRAASFSKDGTRSPRGSRSGHPSSSLQSSKRRSTMNSRDAAYNEEEELRRAIEASKSEKAAESTDGGTRRGKRGRSESVDKQESSKRQRTISGSPSPSQDLPRFALHNDSDDGTNGRSGGAKKIRGAAARNHREKEVREERDRIRAQAANKRANRAERRRIDDSDPAEETPPARNSTKATIESSTQLPDPPHSSLPPDTPPAERTQPSVSHKKGGRPPHSRKGKLGKNQYTRDRDEGDDQSPGRSQSRDVPRGEENGHMNNRGGSNEGKQTKSKGNSGSKITMLDMKRRVAAMLDFISRTQLEMAGESTTPNGGGETEKIMRNLAGAILPLLAASRGDITEEGTNDGIVSDADKANGKNFKDLTLLEMMDELTRQLVKWQNQFT